MDETKSDSILPPRTAVAGSLMERVLHDLKQPLNLIRVVAQDVLLDARKQRLDLEALPESMREIEKAVDEAVIRIDRIRLFTKTPTDNDEVIVASVEAACWAVVRRQRRGRSPVQIAVNLDPGLVPAAVNAVFLEHALWELVDNAAWAAAQATGREPQVELSAHREGEQLVLRVRDNGPGVPEQVREQLFDPFVSTRRDNAGLGLTLAAVLVGEYGGRVTVAETGDDGSVFEIVVPTGG